MDDMDKQKRNGGHARQIVVVSLVSLVICGFLFPLVVTGVAQLVFPYQANGELAHVNGRTVGSFLAVNSTDYSQPVFFHLRNNTASGFDPDITLHEAQAQVPGISDATGIPAATLQSIVNQHVEGVWWVFGSPYVNVQKLNLYLISQFPSVYAKYSA